MVMFDPQMVIAHEYREIRRIDSEVLKLNEDRVLAEERYKAAEGRVSKFCMNKFNEQLCLCPSGPPSRQ